MAEIVPSATIATPQSNESQTKNPGKYFVKTKLNFKKPKTRKKRLPHLSNQPKVFQLCPTVSPLCSGFHAPPSFLTTHYLIFASAVLVSTCLSHLRVHELAFCLQFLTWTEKVGGFPPSGAARCPKSCSVEAGILQKISVFQLSA